MYRTIVKYVNGSDSSITRGWDSIQKDLHCCGVENASDWELNPEFNKTDSYPESCYCRSSGGCPNADFDDVYSKGCYNGVVDEVEGSWKAWGGALIAFAVFELIGIICAVVVIRNNGKAGYYLA